MQVESKSFGNSVSRKKLKYERTYFELDHVYREKSKKLNEMVCDNSELSEK